MAKFKSGDIVQLKSGGPAMTVTGSATTSGTTLDVKWFAGAKMESARVHEDALQPYTTPPASSKPQAPTVTPSKAGA